MIRYLVGMAKLPDYLSRNGRITTKIHHYFDIDWGRDAKYLNKDHFGNEEQFDDKE